MSETTAVARERRPELEERPSFEPGAIVVAKLRYLLSLRLRLVGRPIGEVPGGFRLDLEYVDGRAETRPELYLPAWVGEQDAWLEQRLAAIGGKQEKNGHSRPDLARLYELMREQRRRRGSDQHGGAPHPLLQLQNGDPGIEWLGFDGEVLAGSDWATVRDDGVLELSSRVTLRSYDEEETVVDAALTGKVDLRAAAGGGPGVRIGDAGEVFQRWRAGDLKHAVVPVALAASFTSGTRTAESWAPSRMRRQGEGAWKLARLLRGQFVAVGSAALGVGRPSPLERLALDVYEVGVA